MDPEKYYKPENFERITNNETDMTDFMNMIEDKKGEFFKGKEFEEPQTVKFLKAERVQASSPKFGNEDGDTIEWTFEDGDMTRKFSNHSKGIREAFTAAGVVAGDMIIIQRSGQQMDTKEEIKTEDIPF
jgi:hypothetical protein